MKKLQFLLLLLLLLHGILLLLANINSLNHLKSKTIDLNFFGQKYTKYSSIIKFPEVFILYLNYSGSDRGYAYYSPNVSREKVSFAITDQQNKKIIPIHTESSKFRFNILMINSTKIIENQKIRNQLIKSLSEYIFAKAKNVKELTLKINLKKLKTISEYHKDNKLYDLYNVDAYIIHRKQ